MLRRSSVMQRRASAAKGAGEGDDGVDEHEEGNTEFSATHLIVIILPRPKSSTDPIVEANGGGRHSNWEIDGNTNGIKPLS